MPVRLSDALDWQLDAVESQLTEVRAGVAAANDVADLLRDDAERTLDGMRGHSIVSARLALGGLRRRSFGVGDDLLSTADTVSSFARTVAFHRDRLAADVESVHLRGGAVGEDGTVTSPSAVEPAVEDELDGLEQSITATLRALDSLDVETSRKLALLNESIPYYGDNTDPRTAIAGLVIGAMTQPLGALIDASDDGLRSTRLVARGLGPFGNALGLVAGIAGAPDDEPMSETLVAEGGGLIAGMLMGAAAGSLVPGAGTVAGAALGLLAASGTGFFTTVSIRNHFDNERQGG